MVACRYKHKYFANLPLPGQLIFYIFSLICTLMKQVLRFHLTSNISGWLKQTINALAPVNSCGFWSSTGHKILNAGQYESTMAGFWSNDLDSGGSINDAFDSHIMPSQIILNPIRPIFLFKFPLSRINHKFTFENEN